MHLDIEYSLSLTVNEREKSNHERIGKLKPTEDVLIDFGSIASIASAMKYRLFTATAILRARMQKTLAIVVIKI